MKTPDVFANLADSQSGGLEQAKAVQRKSGLKLAEYLRHQGKLKESELMDYITNQLKIDKYEPDKYPLDPDLKEVLPEGVARKNLLVPLKREGRMLWVATSDPINLSMLDLVERTTRMEVEPVFCPKEELNDLVYSYYGSTATLDDMLGTIDEMGQEIETERDGEGEADGVLNVASLQGLAEEAPVVKLVNQILVQAAQAGASDVHISPKRDTVQLRFRIDGQLREYPAPPKNVFMPVISRLKLLANMDISVTRVPQDGRFSFKIDTKEVNVRASALPTIYGENIVLRLLMRKSGVLTLEDLGMIEEDRAKIEDTIRKAYGMLLATGPTGSGKTTLLYSLLHKIDDPSINIITLEDPVESRIDTIRQVQLNRRAGMTFASGLRSILRQDPDVLLVGEIRDSETAQIAVESAMTGHKLLSTLHTNTACGAVTRLIDMEIEPFLVASTLLVAIGQRLVRRICSECKEPYEPQKSMLKALKGSVPVDKITFVRGVGCPKCNNSGYKGRTGIYEVLIIDELVQDLIMQGAPSKEIQRQVIQAKTFRSMKTDVLNKVAQGQTTLDEASPILFA
ncbi:MAG: type II/IV secretion system protein [Desulfovibrio sp.]|nr:MAG: type II/IV secretion system protein [Desulfovibrio sp.]